MDIVGIPDSVKVDPCSKELEEQLKEINRGLLDRDYENLDIGKVPHNVLEAKISKESPISNVDVSSIVLASYMGDIAHVRFLLEKQIDVNATTETGISALMMASLNGHLEVVRLLIEHGAQVNIQNKYHASALMFASKYGHYEVANLLLEHGAHPDIQDMEKKNFVDACK